MRYERNIRLIGYKGQERLKNSKVAIFGLGGLGNYVSLNLVLAGIGKLLLIDKDYIEGENLNRQFLYRKEDIGKKKVFIAKERLKEINNDVKIEVFDKDIRDLEISKLKNYDLFVDCLDNWDARKILFNLAEKLKKPVVHGAVEGWKGQVGFLRKFDKLKNLKGKAQLGVLSANVSLVASIQSLITIRYLLGEEIEEFLMFIDLKNLKFEKFRI